MVNRVLVDMELIAMAFGMMMIGSVPTGKGRITMPDKETVITHLDDMRLFADTRVYQIVSPENWGIYSDLCDFIDLIKEEILALLKEQDRMISQLEYNLAVTEQNMNYYVNGNN